MIQCVGMDAGLAELVVPRVEYAAAALELFATFKSLDICADDLTGQDTAWLEMNVGAPDRLCLYCHPDVFCRKSIATSTVFPPAHVWEQADAPRTEAAFKVESFSRKRADLFLHHNLLLAIDLASEEIQPPTLSSHLAEGFQAAWEVTVDGRLDAAGLPGYSQAERRGLFSRLFSSAGVLLPEHWQVFQSLWDGGIRGQKEVLAAVQHLPRL